jgi:hypothetical protein
MSAQHNEYQSLSSASKATAWVRFLTADMGYPEWSRLPTPMLGDNSAAITLSREPILTKGNRFYTPDVHYAKESIELGRTCSRKVPTADNISDMLTKMVTAMIFRQHVIMVCGYAKTPPVPPPPRK